MKMSNKVYDILKWVAQIALPAIGAFYTAIATIWGFGGVEEFTGTILAIDTLLGALLQISSSNYKKNL